MYNSLSVHFIVVLYLWLVFTAPVSCKVWAPVTKIFLVDSKGFCDWCITQNCRVFGSFTPGALGNENTMCFGNWIWFHPQAGGGRPTQLSTLEKLNSITWGRKQIQFLKYVFYFLEYRTMEKSKTPVFLGKFFAFLLIMLAMKDDVRFVNTVLPHNALEKSRHTFLNYPPSL
jgi:hypothetical protein